jgi:hypothetical protein
MLFLVQENTIDVFDTADRMFLVVNLHRLAGPLTKEYTAPNGESI